MADIRVELALGADPEGDPAGWEWTDITAHEGGHLLAQDITITMGLPEGDSRPQPAQAQMVLDNPDGRFTPDHPGSPWWPHLQLGTPCRIWARGGVRHLLVPHNPAARIWAPAPLPPAGLDVRVEVALDRLPAQREGRVDRPWQQEWQQIVTHWGETGPGDWGWTCIVNAAGSLTLGWSEDGTSHWAAHQMLTPIPYAPGQRCGLRWTLDLGEDGAGWVYRGWTAPSIDGPWTLLDEIRGHAPTSINPGVQNLMLGTGVGFEDGQFPAPAGRYYGLQIHDGVDGPLLHSLDLTAQPLGAGDVVDDQGVTWSANGGVEVTDWQRRMVGTVEEWAPTWPYTDLHDPDDPVGRPGESRVDITISGVLRRLGQGAQPLQSTLRRFIPVQPGLLAYWPLEDGPDATSAASGMPGGGVPAEIARLDMAAESSLPSSAPLPRTSRDGGLVRAPLPPLPDPSLGWRVEMVYHLEEVPTASRGWIRIRTSGGGIGTITAYIGAGELRMILRDDDDGVVDQAWWTSAEALAVATSGWCRVQLTAEPEGGQWRYRLRWTQIGVWGTWSTSVLRPGPMTRPVRFDCSWNPDLGMPIGHITYVSPASVEVYGPDAGGGADAAYRGERAITRMRRLATEIGLPIGAAGDWSKSPRMGPQRIATALELIQECADAEGGILGERRAFAGLQYTPRAARYNRPQDVPLDARAVVDGQIASEITEPYTPVLDDARRTNRVTASRVDGSSYTAEDPADIARSGLRSAQTSYNLRDDADLPQRAEWALHLGTWPGMRYPEVATDLVVAPQRTDDWLSAGPGARVTVRGLPPQHPPGGADLHVEQMTERISPARWDMQVGAAPGGPWHVFQLGDRVRGRLDTAGSHVAAAVDEEETVLLLSADSGRQPWITTADFPDQFPLYVQVGGEVVQVTAIDGEDGLQTATVIRSVNGVHKPHPAGTPVSLARWGV